MKITRGPIAKAQKVVIYGPEGIGKSSLAADFPDPLFIDTEGSTSNMNVARMDKPTSWQMLMGQIDYVKQNAPCKTLIIDTVDWAEHLTTEFVTKRGNKDSITSFGYGEGFIQLEEEFGKFLNRLSDLVGMGINVVLTAHAKITKFEQPDEMGAYDRWELKLGNKTTAKTASLIKEWADMVLFCNYKTISVATDDKGKKFKGQGGKRVIYTSHHPAWDAKNRFGLPDELDMSFASIAGIFTAQQPVTPRAQPVQQTQQAVEQPAPVATAPTLDISGAEKAQEDLDALVDRIMPSSEPSPSPAETQDDLYIGIPQALVDLMKANGVLPEEVMKATEAKGYYPAGTPIAKYDQGYIDGVLVSAWPQVFEMIKQNRK